MDLAAPTQKELHLYFKSYQNMLDYIFVISM